MSGFTHLDEKGLVRMVDVGDKAISDRTAIAEAYIYMKPETLQRLTAGELPKGNVLTTAHVAGVLAAKKTDQIIPMCHSLPLSGVDIQFAVDGIRSAVHITAECRVIGATGVEMEALTAVSIAALTIYDMCKAVDKRMRIEGIRVLKKTGGKSGDFHVSSDS